MHNGFVWRLLITIFNGAAIVIGLLVMLPHVLATYILVACVCVFFGICISLVLDLG